jgi:hypothetical protein
MKTGRHITVFVKSENVGQFVGVSACMSICMLNNYRSKEMFQMKFVKIKYIDISYSAKFRDFGVIKNN